MIKSFIIRLFSFVFALFLFTFNNCVYTPELHREYIHFTNNSEKNIIIDFSTEYPDTMPCILEKEDQNVYKYRYIAANSTNDRALYYDINLINDSYIPIYWPFIDYYYYDTLCFYMIDEEVYKEYGGFKASLYYKVMQRYDLSKEDMEYLEYKLTYPPSPKMRGMKMFPPYEEAIKQ